MNRSGLFSTFGYNLSPITSRRTFLSTSGLALGTATLPAASRAQSSSARKTVLLQSAWATKNIGDIGHTPRTLRFLEQYLSEAKVILWAMNTNEQVDAMLIKRFPKLEIVKGSLSKKGSAVQEAIGRSDFFLRWPRHGPVHGLHDLLQQDRQAVGPPGAILLS